VFGLANDYLHDVFHLREHWLFQYRWCRRLRGKHFAHHVHMGTNFGIVTTAWDAVFRTTTPRR
jgi:hypothetical protein